MKPKAFIALLGICCVLLSATLCFGTENMSQDLPSAFLPEDKFESETVVEGTPITHDFVVQNKGTAPLKITKIKTG